MWIALCLLTNCNFWLHLISWSPLIPVLVRCPQGRVSLCGQQAACTVGREQLLEALLILYQECTTPELMKIPHVANFVNKCKLQLCMRHCCLWKALSPFTLHFWLWSEAKNKSAKNPKMETSPTGPVLFQKSASSKALYFYYIYNL